MIPGNLTPQAEADLVDVLKRSLSFGADVARRTRGRLVQHFRLIEQGQAIGHRPHFIDHPDHTAASPNRRW